ncbi:MAG: stage V sporulation protein AD [Firmicutes bacterium]|nr:stage V sporulation protein AD [Bacillota bacterium]
MRNTFLFDKTVSVGAGSAVVGPKEAKGPLGGCFDKAFDSLACDGESWEHSEIRMQKDAVDLLLKKCSLENSGIDLLLGGDLIDQLTITNFAAKEREIPFLGLYNACATMAEGLLLGASLIDGGFVRNAVVVASSHNATSERQYRYPTELGVQRSACSQCTVTAAGAMFLSHKKSAVRVVGGTVGTIVDFGVKDPADMGAAMAPAAFRTIKEHMENTGSSPKDYDLICTGDLGIHGSDILKTLVAREYGVADERFQDCGIRIYKENQGVCCGGSGAGCSASVWSSYLLDAIQKGKYHRVLLIGTGALLSSVSVGQGDSIPAIAHGIELVREV